MKIGIVIPVYLRSKDQKYIDLCLKSLENVDFGEHEPEIIVISSGKYHPKLKRVSHIKSKKRLHFPEAANKGIKALKADTDYVLLLNDDVILTKNSVQELIKESQLFEDKCIVGPISNCDSGKTHMLYFSFKDDDKEFIVNRNQYSYEDFDGHFKAAMNAKSVYPPGAILTNHLFFYCVLIPKKVLNEVGYLDKNFLTGCDDIDYSARVREKGFVCAVSLSSLVWHFSGATARHEGVLSDEMRKHNEDYFNEKWNGK